MGDSKILKKFRQVCDEYKAEYVIEGVIEDFDTIYPVPPERMTRGMILNLGEETRFVDFWRTKRPPANVGDRVLVVGHDSASAKNSVQPAVMLSSAENWVLFSKGLETYKLNKMELAFTLGVPALFFIFWLITMEAYPSLAFRMFVICYLIVWTPDLLIRGINSYRRRFRLYICSEEECHLLLEEIGGRFAPRVKATERQTRRTF